MHHKLMFLALALIALMVAGCGSAGSQSYEPKESEGVNTKAEEHGSEATPRPQGPPPPIIGEVVATGDFDLRILEITTDQQWAYPETSLGTGSFGESSAGQFTVVWFSTRNTGDGPLNMDVDAVMALDTGERFAVSADLGCNSDFGEVGELPPRGLQVSCLVFDVPTDATPQNVWIDFNYGHLAPETFDITQAQQENIEPDERLALSYELGNAGYYDLVYEDFYSSESKAQFSQEQYVAAQTEDYKKWVVDDYAFPEVRIEGDTATVERIVTSYNPKRFESYQDRATRELVREDGEWKFVANPTQVEFFRG